MKGTASFSRLIGAADIVSSYNILHLSIHKNINIFRLSIIMQ